MNTLKIRWAAVAHPDFGYEIEEVGIGLDGHQNEIEAMSLAINRFDSSIHGELTRYWIDVELPIPESPIPVHRATVTQVEPHEKG
jgi:hypothetical protein